MNLQPTVSRDHGVGVAHVRGWGLAPFFFPGFSSSERVRP